MNNRTPEQMGISSRNVLAFYKELDACGLSTHAVILSRGNDFFSECYYAPFLQDFKHRMYSSSKSFVSIAVGFCEQDGLLSLDDPIGKFFPEYEHLQNQTTVREMLMMKTSIIKPGSWFTSGTKDRADFYLSVDPQKYPDSLFSYDSNASFILNVIVERLTGKPFLKYLQEKVLDEIGFSKDAYCLLCPGGHSWGDSGILCTARDLWLFARFVLNGGTWNGKRYLNAEYIKKATDTTHTTTNPYGFHDMHHNQGYGYQFWGAEKGCFATKGMGNQVALCDPAHDFIFVINSCNEGNSIAYEQIYRAVYRNIIDNLGDPLPEDSAAKAELDAYIASRKLFFLPESPSSPLAEQINGRVFRCEENATGIRWFRLNFNGDEGTFTYENATGEKAITFGFGHNVFHKFPETDMSDMMGTVPCPGNQYDAAFSADWPDDRTLRVRVQIIDKYFGNASFLFGFRNKDQVTVCVDKVAEYYLNEYKGQFRATAE